MNSTMTRTPDNNTWLVGLDLGERSRGALYFTGWLAGASEHMVGVHVVESWLAPHLRGEPSSVVREFVARAARELHTASPSCIELVEADRAEEGLARIAGGATALVIGRAAHAGQHPFNRLGHVARRLLRSLPAPVVVVPPDLSAVAPGPILLATDLGVASEAAVAFALRLAAQRGRDLEVVHVGMPRYSDLVDALEPEWVDATDTYRAQVALALQTWMRDHGLADRRHHLLYGDAVQGIEAVVVGSNAAMVVVGSRHLGVAGRVFLGSTASALAGLATCPVAVVPST